MLAGDVSSAINDYVNGIRIGLIHGREIGVFGENDAAGPGMLFEIFLDRLFGFGNIDGENDQSLVGKLLVDGLDQRLLQVTVLAPGGPEFEQDDFAFHRIIVETLSRSGFGAEARSGLVVVISGEGAGGGQQQKHTARGQGKAAWPEMIARSGFGRSGDRVMG